MALNSSYSSSSEQLALNGLIDILRENSASAFFRCTSGR